VLLVGNERVMRAGLRALLDNQAGTTVVGEVEALDAALSLIISEQPDVTLLDPDHYSGADFLPNVLRAAISKTRVVLLTGAPESASVAQALGNGAVGLVSKQQGPEVLMKAIEKVHAGELWLDRSVTARLLTELSRAGQAERSDPEAVKVASVTARERQVIMLVGQGMRNMQIANRLNISEVTVRNHLTSVFRKLELANRCELVVYSFRHGLATMPTPARPAAPQTEDGSLEQQKKTS
jgi:DNA-binding NarL/FixJ family response regulator